MAHSVTAEQSLPTEQSIDHILNWCGTYLDCEKHRDSFFSRPTGQKIFYWMYEGPPQIVYINRGDTSNLVEIEAIQVRDEDYKWAVDVFNTLDYYLEPEFVETNDISKADLRLWGTSGHNLINESSTLFGFATPFNADKKGYVDVVVNVEAGILSGDTEDFDPENTHTALHEIGHALGLSHPGVEGQDLPYWDLYDSEDTIMSYNKPADGIHADFYSEGDILALQEIWGTEGSYQAPPQSESEASEGSISENNDFEFIYAKSGKGKLKGNTKQPTNYIFDSLDVFGKKGADKITKFIPSEGDSLIFTTNSLPELANREQFFFGNAKNKKQLKKLSKDCYDFVYYQKKGMLYFDGNCSAKGWGSTYEGGLIAILKNKPELTTDNLIVEII
jgi:hypothetical protein